jgi:hypothetical protein
MIAVTVNDRPVDVPAIVERGRVFLPMRATFAALGATVSYDSRSRVVVARNAQHALRLPLRKALVIAGRAYVPLRTVAEALGASVTYDARAHVVRVVQQAVLVNNLDPAAGANVATAYPTISASLGDERAANADITLTVDGRNVTALATFDGSTITFMPRTGLPQGSHTVVFAGRTMQGEAFDERWTFTTTAAAPPDAGPAFLSPYDYRFYINGARSFYPGDWMHFTLIAPPGGSAVLQLCDIGYQYPFWSGADGTTYVANVQAPYGYWLPACQVTAIYTSWSGARTYVPIPVTIGLYTRPAASPTPHPATHPVPPSPRKPEPTPVPQPVHTPAPPATPRPLPVPRPIRIPPHPRPTPPLR